LTAFLAAPLAGWAGDSPNQTSTVVPVGLPALTTAAKPEIATYLLQYKFHQGEEIRTKVAHIATIETTIGGTTQTTDMKSYSMKLWRVTAVDKSGAATIENLVERVDMRNKMSGRQEVRYNSKTDTVAPLGYEDIAKSIGKVLSIVTLDPAGNVLKREDKLARAAPNGGGMLVPPLPKEAIPIGHVWSLPQEVNVALDEGATKAIQTRQRYELEKVEQGIATIAVETQILTPTQDPKIRVQLIQRLSKGHIRFDLAAGRIVGQRTDLDETVLGFSGPDSSMHYVSCFAEELFPPSAETAAADVPAAAPGKK
jgi:hypothetical protein